MRVDYHQRLVPVIRYLEQHFNEPLNLPEVAALANLSPYHFHRTFKAVQGETLADFIRRLRLEAAADDLFKSKPNIFNNIIQILLVTLITCESVKPLLSYTLQCTN